MKRMAERTSATSRAFRSSSQSASVYGKERGEGAPARAWHVEALRNEGPARGGGATGASGRWCEEERAARCGSPWVHTLTHAYQHQREGNRRVAQIARGLLQTLPQLRRFVGLVVIRTPHDHKISSERVSARQRIQRAAQCTRVPQSALKRQLNARTEGHNEALIECARENGLQRAETGLVRLLLD